MSIGQVYDRIATKWVAFLDKKPTVIFLALSIATIIWLIRQSEIKEIRYRQDLKDAATLLSLEQAAHEITRKERDAAYRGQLEATKEANTAQQQTIQILMYGKPAVASR